MATPQLRGPKNPPSQQRLSPVIHSFDIQLSLTAYTKSQLNQYERRQCATPKPIIAKNRVRNPKPINGRTTSCVTPIIARVSHRSDLSSLATKILPWISNLSVALSASQAPLRSTAGWTKSRPSSNTAWAAFATMANFCSGCFDFFSLIVSPILAAASMIAREFFPEFSSRAFDSNRSNDLGCGALTRYGSNSEGMRSNSAKPLKWLPNPYITSDTTTSARLLRTYVQTVLGQLVCDRRRR